MQGDVGPKGEKGMNVSCPAFEKITCFQLLICWLPFNICHCLLDRGKTGCLVEMVQMVLMERRE